MIVLGIAAALDAGVFVHHISGMGLRLISAPLTLGPAEGVLAVNLMAMF